LRKEDYKWVNIKEIENVEEIQGILDVHVDQEEQRMKILIFQIFQTSPIFQTYLNLKEDSMCTIIVV
jgi:hypothetical protein